MGTANDQPFVRQQAETLAARLSEPRRFLQVVAGARQVGKTTLAGQVLERLDSTNVFVSADEPTLGDAAWLAAQWDCGLAIRRLRRPLRDGNRRVRVPVRLADQADQSIGEPLRDLRNPTASLQFRQ